MFGRRRTQCFISDKGEIVACGELMDPMIHSADDGAHAQFFVEQHFAHCCSPELELRAWIASCQLPVQRKETIGGVSRQQDGLRPVKRAPRDEIFTANSVPPIAFGAVLE